MCYPVFWLLDIDIPPRTFAIGRSDRSAAKTRHQSDDSRCSRFAFDVNQSGEFTWPVTVLLRILRHILLHDVWAYILCWLHKIPRVRRRTSSCNLSCMVLLSITSNAANPAAPEKEHKTFANICIVLSWFLRPASDRECITISSTGARKISIYILFFFVIRFQVFFSWISKELCSTYKTIKYECSYTTPRILHTY